MRCFIEKINDDSVCVCGEFDRDIHKDPCYQSLQGQSGADFSKNLANDAMAYFQDSGILSLFALSVLISFTISRFN